MPEYVFGAPYALNYPEGKDAAGGNLSLVQPGDIRDLDEAPDHWWREAADEDRAQPAGRQADEAATLAGDQLQASEEQAGQHEDAGGQEPEPGEAPGEPVTEIAEQTQPGE